MGFGNKRKQRRLAKQKRVRKKIVGTPERPRLCVFRSAKHIYVQVIDDTGRHTLAAASTNEEEVKKQPAFENKSAAANFVGKLVAGRAMEKGIKTVVFDRNGFLYHGRIKAVSDGAREVGLDF